MDGDDTVWSDYTELKSITFSNTYEATGSTTLDVRKYLNGRTFNEDDVFTFRVTAVNGAPLLEVDSNGKAYTITDGTDEDGNECKVYTGTDGSVYYVYTDTDGYSYILITVTGAELLASAATDSLGNYYGSATLLTLYYTQDDIGNTYTYRVTEEQGSAPGVSYDTYSYGHAVDITVGDASNGSLYFTKANTADVDDAEVAVVVNTFSQGSMNIYGTKVWVDGDASHTNSDEVTLTLQYLDSNGDWVDYEGDYEVTWGTEYPNNWRILNLPQYDENGNAYVWRVVETSISGYVTTYDTTDEDASDAEAVPSTNSSSSRYTITNTIEQEYTTLTGTKTWIDGGLEHDNSTEVTLIVTRTSTGTGTTTLTVGTDYTVGWSDNTYTITGTGSGLPVYDDYGYTYTYAVTESTNEGQITLTIDGVTYTYNVFDDGQGNITNTREEEDPTSDKTESGTAKDNGTTSEGTDYATYGTVSVGDTITYTISYYNGNSEEADVTITDVLDDGVTFVSATDPESWTGTEGGSYTFTVETTGTSFNYGGTVTWTFTAAAFERGYVTLTVEVNENAKTASDGLSSDWDDTATVDNQATVAIGNDYEKETDIVTNPLEPEDPTSDKTETYANDVAATYDDETGYYDEVYEGSVITYRISYYNGNNTSADVVITDALDDGVTFVSATNPESWTDTENDSFSIAGEETTTASDNVTTYSYGGTVTWTFTAAAFERGYVTLTVQVNENAKTIESDETVATVENQATVTIGEYDNDTDIVVNPLTDDDETEPTKELSSINGTSASESETDGNGNAYVSVGDSVTYTIGYTNNTASVQTVYIIDTLDDGVDYDSSSDGGVYYEEAGTIDGTTVTYPADSVVWVIEDVQPFTTDNVTLTVVVDESAKSSENNYNVADGYSLTYGVDDDTTASIANQATVYIGNSTATYTEVVENPLEPDEPTEPTKTVDSDEDDVFDDNGETVSVGDVITYVISYYNNQNTATTVTIVDALDDGVDFVSASGVDESSDEYDAASTTADYVSYTYDEDAHTVTWTVLNATPLTEKSVTLQVMVNENAKTTESDETTATVENQATVTVGETTNDTEIVVNPIDPEEPSEPTKVVSAASEAGVSGANVAVGDQITYTISYYNHTNTAATVTIVDALDEYVDFVSATDGGEYDEATHTVTWTIDSVSAFTGGTVDLTVEVNSSAETQVENDAVVTVGDNTATTDLVTNPVDDEPEDPVKTVDTDGDEDFEDDGATVSVGDEITYTISYYNYYAVEADIAITDQLDSGVEFVSATDKDGNTLTADDVFSSEDDTYVKWPTFTAAAYERGTVTLTVRVTEAAKTADSSGDATVDNQAGVTIAENDYTTNIVTNPLEPDDPTEPTKTVDVGADTQVSVGDTLVYTIGYYNNLSTAATVVIEDALDEGVDFVEASDGGVYDEATHTVTWTIEDVSAFTEGSVTLTVEVNANAKAADDNGNASVVNDADVTVGNQAKQTTDPVENPLEPDDPEDPVKTVDVGNGNAVGIGELITYTIKYYNYNNTAATVTITDVLEDGLTWVSGGTLGTDGKTVTWTIEDVAPYTYGTVTVTAQVNSNAKTVAEGDTSASVENTASVTVGNDAAVDTNTVTNPIDPDAPSTPTKAVSATSAAGANGESVEVGDEITYVISYYNHNNAATTVTITDALDENVTFVSATNENGYILPGSAYSEADHTVTWTIEAAAYETGTVTVTVKVADSAAGGKVENTASVQIGNDAAVSTNSVTNDVEETPATPSPSPSSGTTPDTGDESRLGLWIAILAAGALGLVCVTVITTSRKKRSEK
ncbi:MAG: DUF11 domain-containing protein [Oscillospiraceae bacterium]|nr:DUF11 domain-containing protein [Oscillospiraceae bacterium]